MFGVVAGFIIALLCFLQVIYSAGLWIFSLPGLIKIMKDLDNNQIPKVNPLLYVGFSFSVIMVTILTVINFFISPYKSMWDPIGDNIGKTCLIFVGILVVSNILRITVMSKFIKEPEIL